MSTATRLFLTNCAIAPLSLLVICGVHLSILPAWWRRNSTVAIGLEIGDPKNVLILASAGLFSGISAIILASSRAVKHTPQYHEKSSTVWYGHGCPRQRPLGTTGKKKQLRRKEEQWFWRQGGREQDACNRSWGRNPKTCYLRALWSVKARGRGAVCSFTSLLWQDYRSGPHPHSGSDPSSLSVRACHHNCGLTRIPIVRFF